MIRDGLVYRKNDSPKKGEPDSLQLLLPRTDVNEVLRQCHAGVVAGHFGIRKTLDQVKRRFYWPSWKEDTKLFLPKMCRMYRIPERKTCETRTVQTSFACSNVRKMVY